MILAWLIYYANRMSETNLWFHALVILLLFTPRIDFSLLRLLSRRFQFARLYVVLALSLVGGLLFWSADRTFWDGLNYYRLFHSSCHDSPGQVKDFCIIGNDRLEISTKIDFLKGIDEKQNYLIISLLPTQIRLMGFNEGFPWYEPFGETPRSRDFDAMTNWIEARGPRYVVTDDPASTAATVMSNRTQHFQRLVNGLKSYRKYKIDAGWIIYQRRSLQPPQE